MLIVEIKCLDDLPARVLEVLKTFLDARSGEEKAVLVLETKSKGVTTKYRSVEDTVVGMPSPVPTSARRRKNPARARRSKLRLEAFTRKKLEDRATLENRKTSDSLAAGAAIRTRSAQWGQVHPALFYSLMGKLKRKWSSSLSRALTI